MEEMHLPEEMRSHLTQLIGKTCWGIFASKETDSLIELQIGDKVERLLPPSNPPSSEGPRIYEGEYCISIDCAWRVDSENQVLFGSGESSEKGGPMRLGLTRLLGEKISSIEIALPGLDMTIGFSNSLTLRVFCNQSEMDGLDNYTLFLPGFIYEVGPRSQLRCERK